MKKDKSKNTPLPTQTEIIEFMERFPACIFAFLDNNSVATAATSGGVGETLILEKSLNMRITGQFLDCRISNEQN